MNLFLIQGLELKVGQDKIIAVSYPNLRLSLDWASKYPKPAYLVIEGPRRIWKMEDYSVSLRILDLDLLQVSYPFPFLVILGKNIFSLWDTIKKNTSYIYTDWTNYS